jgi:hypothetical protein
MPRIPRPEMRALKSAYPTQKRFETALDFAMSVINDPDAPLEAKLRLARAVLPYQEARIESAAGAGKKERARVAAEHAAQGAFEPPPLPRKPN